MTTTLTYEFDDNEFEFEIEVNEEEVRKFFRDDAPVFSDYPSEVDFDTALEDEDFIEWLKDKHYREAEEEYNESCELQSEYESMANSSHYW